MSRHIIVGHFGYRVIRLSICMYAERFVIADSLLLFSKLVGKQAMQNIENINYLLDCHVGGRGFESRPLRHFLCDSPHNSLFLRLDALAVIVLLVFFRAGWGSSVSRAS